MALAPAGVDLTETESSSDDAIMNQQKPKNNNRLKANFDASAESAPEEPVKGGEFGFVKVSRIASIEVKNTASNQEFYAKPLRSIKTVQPKSTTVPSRDAKERYGSKGSTKPRKKNVLRELENDDSSSDEEIVRPENDPMNVVENSPYEGNANAEREVQLFEDLKNLLTEGSIRASKIFGTANARILVKSYAEIDQSGMVYSQEWVDGIMRGSNVGVLPKDLLLLCLISSRLVKVDEFLMAGLTRDLEVFKVVKEAVQVWDMEDDYKRIAGASNSLKNFTFNGKRRHCFKCEIFVARAYSCYKAFGLKGPLEKNLLAKVRKCLDIMESRLPEPKGNKKRKKIVEKPAAEVVPLVEPLVDEPPPPKRKRGRPPKNKQLVPPKLEPKDVSVDDLDSTEVLPRRGPPSKPARPKGRKETEALTDLVSKFEEQYHEMGKQYKAMGETLSRLRSKLGEERNAREQELRNELLVEVQKKLMNH